ncbi:hypothetical protein OAT16_11710 [Prolixibacteraceae bacterium]|nr:hypothetical protein [Prolixibacteraceae bacterium]
MDISLFAMFLSKYQCGKDFVSEIFKEIIEQKEKSEFKHFRYTPVELYQDLLEN